MHRAALASWLVCSLVGVCAFSALTATQAASVCDNQCQSQQRESLLALYEFLGGPEWARRDGWGSADHCSWAGVHCCAAQTAAKASGDRSGVCPLPGGVAGLDLALNNATGPWPASALAGLSSSLAYLNFRGNSLQGQLPASIGDLKQLSVLFIDNTGLSGSLPAGLGQLLNLTQLSAANNRFTGPIPAGLATLQRLQRLTLYSNQLTGTFPAKLLALPQLQQLDVSGNRLTGQLQGSGLRASQSAAASYNDAVLGVLAGPQPQISEINLSYNQLSGSIPAPVASLPVMLLDMSHNKLRGTLPAQAVGGNLVLQQLLLSYNQLSGTLSPDLFRGNLRVLDLSSNAFTGTLPQLPGLGASIEQLDLSNNSFTGAVPQMVGQLGSLQSLKLAGNRLQTMLQGLPPYLEVDNSAPAAAVDPVGRPALLCQPVVLTSSTAGGTAAAVQLDPATYGFEGCFCKAPFEAVTQQEGGRTVDMRCVASQQGSSGVQLAYVLGPVLSVLAVTLIALACIAFAWRCGLAGLVQRITVEAEKKMPPGGAAKDITLVLTDVQGSTELWEWDQQLASDAFQVHDRILRQYMTQFYGYEVSTEGDAFLVAFHEPFDAVAWCLCVQLALHYADWPEPLLMHKSTCLDTADTLELKRRKRQIRWQNRMTRAAAAAPGSVYSQAAAAAAGATNSNARRRSRTGPPQASGPGDAAAADGNDEPDHVPDTLPPAPLVAVDQDPGAAYEDEEDLDNSSSDNLLDARRAAEYAAYNGPVGSKVVGKGVLFRGLRVRMSVATGGVDSVRLHSVTQRAEYVGEVLRKVQAVGETPQGGQIMIDSETFRGIHSRLPELGGAVLEATQKLLRNNQAAGPNAQELVELFSMPPTASLGEGLKRSDFIGRSSPPRPTNHNTGAAANQAQSPAANPAHSTITVTPAAAGGAPRDASGAEGPDAGGLGAHDDGSDAVPGQSYPHNGGWSSGEQYHLLNGDIEEGRFNASPRQARAQRGLLHQAAQLLGLRDDDSVTSSIEGVYGATSAFASHSHGLTGPAVPGAGAAEAGGVVPVLGGTVKGLKEAPLLGSPGNLLGLGKGGKGRRPRRKGENGAAVRRRSSLSYGVMVIDMGVHQLSGLPQKVNLVQVMPCGLEDRARFFPRLDSLRQETPGYFDAPAAGLVPLSPGCIPNAPMPTVTIVFCTIDKYCEIVEVNREAAELALELYSDCVRWLLLVGGGYECQEAEGTFMVAFSSADVAIEWCLMVQQVLRDMSWPASVLELPTCEEERDMHGNVMFRGPRVKMGVYSGTPTRVIPHTTTGRADYFGPLVNRAARYCHAAARGGQVLVPKELMCEVISKWVLIDPTVLLQSDRLLEFVAYFDEERRLWPWMFKRRTHWDVPMPPQLYEQASVPVPHTDEAPMAVPAAAGQQQQQQQQAQYSGWWGPAGEQARAAAGGAAGDVNEVETRGVHGLASAKPAAADGAAAVGGVHGSSREQQQGLSLDQAGPHTAEQPGSSEGSSQNQSTLSDLMPTRLAPLHEAAECSSSKCASEGEASAGQLASTPPVEQPVQVQQQQQQPQQRLQQQVQQPPLPPAPLPPLQEQPQQQYIMAGPAVAAAMIRQNQALAMRRHSDLAQSYSRLGPQAVQALQAMQAGYTQPSSMLYSPRQGLPLPPASVAAALMAQSGSTTRYRRPSYLSDISASARYRRYSNMSDSSMGSAQFTSGSGMAVTGWSAPGGGPSSRRPSAMSDFFPIGVHSRRPSSNMSGDGFVPPAANLDGFAAVGAAVPGVLVPGVIAGTVPTRAQQQALQLAWLQQQQHQQRRPASPRMAQQQQPQQQPQQPIYQLQMQHRGALVGPGAYPGQSAALAAAAAVAAASHHPQYLPQQQHPGGEYNTASCSQHGGTPSGSVHAPGRFKTGLAQGSMRYQQQQQPPFAAGTTVQPSLPTSGPSSGHGSGALSNAVQSNSTTGSRGSAGGRSVPAAMMLQGLENQVVPGMLHSSNRLRLVSKRRRQMSYCFFQESSKPGLPPDGEDPKRLLPAGYSSAASGAGMGMGLGPIPGSNYAGSRTAPSVAGMTQFDSGGGLQGGGGYAAGSAAGGPRSVQSIGSGGICSAGGSRRGSGVTGSGCESAAGSGAADGDAAAAAAAIAAAAAAGDGAAVQPAAAEVDFGGDSTAAGLGGRLDETGRMAGAGADSLAADGAAGGPSAALWSGGSRAAMDSYCGLPEIDPLPDLDVLESLRLSVPQRGRRPSNLSTVTGVADSVVGFEGPSIGSMCADIMRGRWLWIRELLVHDLGQFKFKGVAGVHSIVSVTSEELGGRTFPTTIRRGKGEQIRLGRGLLALVQMLPSTRPSTWMGPYQGQQLLQNPAPPMAPSEVQQQQPFVPPCGMCQACGSLGPQVVRVNSGALTPSAEAAQLQMELNWSMHSGMAYPADAAAAAAGPAAAAARGGGYASAAAGTGYGQPTTAGVAAAAAAFAPGVGGGVQLQQPQRLRHAGSLGDLRVAHQQAALAAAAAAAGQQTSTLQHANSAPESVTASAADAAASAGSVGSAADGASGADSSYPLSSRPNTAATPSREAGDVSAGLDHQRTWPEEAIINSAVPHYVHPSHTPSQAAQQFWHMQTHLWQVQLQSQLARQRRRRHSVCMGSMQSRYWTKPFGVMGEMMPFQETEEWPLQSAASMSSTQQEQQQRETDSCVARQSSASGWQQYPHAPSHAYAAAPTSRSDGGCQGPATAATTPAAAAAAMSHLAAAGCPSAAGGARILDGDDDVQNTSDIGSAASEQLLHPGSARSLTLSEQPLQKGQGGRQGGGAGARPPL